MPDHRQVQVNISQCIEIALVFWYTAFY